MLRTRPEIFEFEPDSGLKRSQDKPKIPGMVPADRRTPIPSDVGQKKAFGWFPEGRKGQNYVDTLCGQNRRILL